MPVKTDNAAGRLHELMLEADLQKNVQAWQAWNSVLGEPGNGPQLFIKIAKIELLIEEVLLTGDRLEEEDVFNFSGQRLPIQRLRTTVNPTAMTSPWEQVSKHIDPAALGALSACADWFSRHAKDNAHLDTETLRELEDDISDLIDKFNEHEDLPAPLRQRILHLLRDARRAIEDYKIEGSNVLEEWAERGIGVAVITLAPENQDVRDDPEISKLRQFVAKVATKATEKAAGKLGETTFKLLTDVVEALLLTEGSSPAT